MTIQAQTKASQRTPSQAALQELTNEIGQIREEISAKVGENDARHIRRIIKAVHVTEVAGRGMLFLSFLPPFWVVGTLLLAISKILDDAEVGHNVMHGQYDWLNDPRLKGEAFEFGAVATSDNWRYTHNDIHHTYTGIKGLDKDIGVIRTSAEQPWRPRHLLQPLMAVLAALFFQWAVAIQNLRVDEWLRGERTLGRLAKDAQPITRKATLHFLKEYVFFPALAWPIFLQVLTGNLAANGLRNIWLWAIIFCGHYTHDVQFFDEGEIKKDSTGFSYYRQITGSSNFSGSRLLHIMTGHLGYHIEHHLYPDLPACRYGEISLAIRQVCMRHGILYNTAPLHRQFLAVIFRIIRYSFP